MQRAVSYHIQITRTDGRYIARAPAFPDLVGQATSLRLAYARLKVLIKADILGRLTAGVAAPRDSVVETKTLRIDLWYLSQQEDLQ